MPVSVTMPRLGESVTEGTVTRWLKQVGDRVEVDEPLLEVSTDKVDTEIPSPAAGVLARIVVGRGRDGRGRLGTRGDRRATARTPLRPQLPAATGTAEPSTERLPPPPLRRRSPRPRPGTSSGSGCGTAARACATHGSTGDRQRHPHPRPRRRRPMPVRRWHSGEDAGPRRVGDRGHGDPLAQAGRRPDRGRRAAARGLHRQGRHRDPVSGRGCGTRDQGGRGRDRRRSARTWPSSARAGARPGAPHPTGTGSRRRRRPRPPAPRTGAGRRPAPAPSPAPTPAPAPAPPPSPAPVARAPAASGRRRRRLRDAAGAQARRRARRRPAIDLVGTGVGGRIRKQDVLDAAAQASRRQGSRSRRRAGAAARASGGEQRFAAGPRRCPGCERSSRSADGRVAAGRRRS